MGRQRSPEEEKERRRTLKKIAFYLFLFMLAILTSKDLTSIVKDYLYNNTDTDMTINFNVTFCIDPLYAYSHFPLRSQQNVSAKEWDGIIAKNLTALADKDAFLNERWDWRMVVDAYEVVANLITFERETTGVGFLNVIGKVQKAKMVHESIKFWLAEIKKRNVTFAEFHQKTGFEMMRRALERFNRLSSNEDEVITAQLTITWISKPTYNSDNAKPINDMGEFFTLTISMNSNAVAMLEREKGRQIGCMRADFHGRPSNQARLEGSKSQSRDGLILDELCPGMDHQVIGEIRAIYTSLEGSADTEEAQCKVYGGDDETEIECKERCRLQLIEKACDCVAPTLTFLAARTGDIDKQPICTYDTCNLNITANKANIEEEDACKKKCYPSCTKTHFIVKRISKGGKRIETTSVTLIWNSMEYLLLNQQVKWSLDKFLANIGGSLGAWMGLSALGILQAVLYIYHSIKSHFTKNRRRSRVGTGASIRANVIRVGDDDDANDAAAVAADTPVKSQPVTTNAAAARLPHPYARS